MKSTTWRVAGVIAIIVSAEGGAHAQGRDVRGPAEARAEARGRFDRAAQHYKDGRYDAALAELQRAYALAPSYRILYNVALAQKKLKRFSAALATLERYFEEGGSDIPPERRAEAEEEMRFLRTVVGEVVVMSREPGVRVSLDDMAIGETPLSRPIRVDAGQHTISGFKSGMSAFAQSILVAGGEVVGVDVSLAELVRPPERTAVTPAPPTRSPPPPWALWATAGALVVGAGVTGAFACRPYTGSTTSARARTRRGRRSSRPSARRAHSRSPPTPSAARGSWSA